MVEQSHKCLHKPWVSLTVRRRSESADHMRMQLCRSELGTPTKSIKGKVMKEYINIKQ